MDWVFMESPTGEVKEVEATAAALTPLMVAGRLFFERLAGLDQSLEILQSRRPGCLAPERRKRAQAGKPDGAVGIDQ